MGFTVLVKNCEKKFFFISLKLRVLLKRIYTRVTVTYASHLASYIVNEVIISQLLASE